MQDTVFGLEVLVALDVLPDKLIDFGDLELQCFDHFADTLSDFRMQDRRCPVGFLGVQIAELAASPDQFGQFCGLGRGVCFGGRPDLLGKGRQDLRIDGIGLGPLPHAPGKIPHLPRIDHHDGQGCGQQFGHDGAFVAASCFQYHEGNRVFFEGLTQLVMSLRGVGQRGVEYVRAGGDTEGVLGDIDTDINGFRFRHGDLPYLQMRTRRACGTPAVPTAVRVRPTGATRILLRDGLGDQETTDLSLPVGLGSARCAPLRAGLRSASRTSANTRESIRNHS